MRNLPKLLAMPLLAFLFSCQPEAKQTATEEPKALPQISLDDIITKELESGVENNDIFLDFAFGMKREEVKAKVEKMVKNKKLKVKNGSVIYGLDLNGETKDVMISPFYDNNRLYELGLTVKADQYDEVSNIFLTKYGGCEVYSDTTETTKQLYLIKGNRQIKISSGDEVQVFYTDLKVQQKLGAKEGEKQAVKVKSKSANDL